MRSRRHARRAFTLLEMLVALAIMGLLATSLYASLHIGFRARRAAERAIGPVRAASLALELVRRDVEAALPPTGILAGTFYGEDGSSGGRDADTLTWFANVGEPAQGAADIVKLELALTTLDDDGGNTALVRRLTTNLLAPKAQEPTEEVLCRRVVALSLRYFDGSDWLDNWDSSTQDNTLPLAVEVVLEIKRDAEATATAAAAETYKLSRVFLLPCGSPPSEGNAQVTRETRW